MKCIQLIGTPGRCALNVHFEAESGPQKELKKDRKWQQAAFPGNTGGLNGMMGAPESFEVSGSTRDLDKCQGFQLRAFSDRTFPLFDV